VDDESFATRLVDVVYHLASWQKGFGWLINQVHHRRGCQRIDPIFRWFVAVVAAVA
jgi:hypothetical protein